MRQRIISQTKTFAYSPRIRNFARRVITAEAAEPLRRIAQAKGYEGHLRRLAAETLAEGKYFAKLTIIDWKNFEGQAFQLEHDDKIVYGNVVRQPDSNYPVEYRNIVVDSERPGDFNLDIDAQHTLQIGRGAFSTPQQLDYDRTHDVEQHDGIFYSLRGNTTAPDRILLTFPDFSNTASRISYRVEYLDQLNDSELSDTLIICFQDRYLTAGSYMTVDSSGRSLLDRVNAVIERFISQFRITDDKVMIFGVSKGGSIAIQYAENHPRAHLVIVAPQLNVPYSLCDPSLKDNLGQEVKLTSMVQPEQLIRTFFREHRAVDYFYTSADEQSNYSLIEIVGDVPGLTKFRISGDHDDVARSSWPTILNIIRRFLSTGTDHSTAIDEMNTFPSVCSLGVQVRIDDSNAPASVANWYLEGRLGRSGFRQLVSDHQLPFIKFTSESQRLQPELDDLAGFSALTAYTENGDRWYAPFPAGTELHLDHSPHTILPSARLQLNTKQPTPYVIVKGNRVAHFQYQCLAGVQTGDRLDVHIVDDIDGFDLAEARHHTSARYVISVTDVEDEEMVGLLIQRFKIASSCSLLRVSRTEADVGSTFAPGRKEGVLKDSVARLE